MSHDTDLVLCHNLGRLRLHNMTRTTNITTTRGNSPCQLITTLSHMLAISSNIPVVIVVVVADMLLMADHPIDLVLYPLRFKQVDIIRRLTPSIPFYGIDRICMVGCALIICLLMLQVKTALMQDEDISHTITTMHIALIIRLEVLLLHLIKFTLILS